ncbi:unnamed protein product [Ambrosiozyma monospora]|uniref:ATP-dependent DNA helicase PIF1 n=1 Tax=Ambrosiozyma monospora TaxID=43982 RepID=A0A9W7DE56_AMBMO|nr:unnamed protein product [Ambrosiozyma monospora]
MKQLNNNNAGPFQPTNKRQLSPPPSSSDNASTTSNNAGPLSKKRLLLPNGLKEALLEMVTKHPEFERMTVSEVLCFESDHIDPLVHKQRLLVQHAIDQSSPKKGRNNNNINISETDTTSTAKEKHEVSFADDSFSISGQSPACSLRFDTSDSPLAARQNAFSSQIPSTSQQQQARSLHTAAEPRMAQVLPDQQTNFQDSTRKKFSDGRLTLLTQHETMFGNKAVKNEDTSSDSITAKPSDQVPGLRGHKLHDPDQKVQKQHQAIVLSEEQNKVIELAQQGKSIFYTGSAGTGKSMLLRSLIKTLKQTHEKGGVAVTASTGLAACNIGGMTLHSFAGIGLGKGTPDELVRRIRRNQTQKERWTEVEVLIIDEISMIDGELLEKLNVIAQKLRRNSKPFGGIQLILCGDFYQLPPVSKDKQALFAFESDIWKKCIDYTIVLEKVFRQKGDKIFVDMLQEVRNADISPGTERKFKYLERRLKPKHGVTAAHLFSTRREVDKANSDMLRQLPGKALVFTAKESGSVTDPEKRKKLLSNFLAPQRIALKKDAQVMMVKNIDSTLVNGSLGRVIGFMDPDTYSFWNSWKHGNDISEEEMRTISMYNKTDANHSKHLVDSPEDLDSDLEDSCFDFLDDLQKATEEKERLKEEALRARSEIDSSVLEIDVNDNPVAPETKTDITTEETDDGDGDPIPVSVARNIKRKRELLNQLFSNSRGRRLPLVRFIQTDGQTRDVLVEAESFSIEDEHEKPIVQRTQLPLILAWAISIHKSQGQTLPMVKVDLRRIFENGQAYVALSRAVNRAGLQVLNFDKSKIRTHAKVVEFYKKLTNVYDAIKLKEKDEKEQKNKRSTTPQEDALNHLVSQATSSSISGGYQEQTRYRRSLEDMINNKSDEL